MACLSTADTGQGPFAVVFVLSFLILFGTIAWNQLASIKLKPLHHSVFFFCLQLAAGSILLSGNFDLSKEMEESGMQGDIFSLEWNFFLLHLETGWGSATVAQSSLVLNFVVAKCKGTTFREGAYLLNLLCCSVREPCSTFFTAKGAYSARPSVLKMAFKMVAMD